MNVMNSRSIRIHRSVLLFVLEQTSRDCRETGAPDEMQPSLETSDIVRDAVLLLLYAYAEPQVTRPGCVRRDNTIADPTTVEQNERGRVESRTRLRYKSAPRDGVCVCVCVLDESFGRSFRNV